jgi:thiol-disulfide isomerase/thioredoxin
MKFLSLILILSLGLNTFAQTKGIKFINDTLLFSVLKKSRTENKMIFIDCYTSWCAPCKNMDRQIYTDETAGVFYNKNFINVKFDMEKAEGIKIKKSYNVEAYPTFLYLNSKGELIFKAVGFADSPTFINIGQNALKSNISKLSRKLDNPARTLADIYSFLLANFNYQKKDSLMKVYYTLIPPADRLSIESWTLFKRFVIDLDCDFFDYFITNRKSYEDKFGANNVSDKIISLFTSYIDKYRKDSNKMWKIWNTDSVLVKETMSRNIESYAIEDCNNDKTNRVLWDTMISVTDLRYKYYAIYDIYDGADYVLENYRRFNDTTALTTAKKWANRLITVTPEADYFNNIYSNILFELGEINEAIRYKEIAIARAKEQNQTSSLEKYLADLDRFKGIFKK